MKRYALIGFTLLMLILNETSHTLAAEVLIDDTFSDTTKINPHKTTAYVDTKKGWVMLSPKNLGNAVALYKDRYDVTVLNGRSVDTYRFNGTAMIKDETLSIMEGLSDPIGVSVQAEGEYIVLDRTLKKAITYQSNGWAMIENPFLTANNLSNPVAVTAVYDGEGYGVLEKRDIKCYSYDGEKMVINGALSLAMDELCNPIGFGISSKGQDFAVIDRSLNRILYLKYDGSTYFYNLDMSITTPGELTNPKSIGIFSEGSYLILDGDQVKAYNYDGNGMAYNHFLSVSGLSKPLSVAVKPGSYNYAVLQLDENDLPFISFYAFNGSGMEEIHELRITGLESIPYANEQVLMGKEINSSTPINALRIIVEEELPAGTSITWEVTVDGVTWKEADKNGSVKFTKPGTKPNYRAILRTDDTHFSPKVMRVSLIDSSLSIGNFQIKNIVGPKIPENPTLPTNQQVKIWAGYNVTFQIDTGGCAKNVIAHIEFLDKRILLNSLEGTITSNLPPEEYNNTWEGTFHTSGNIPKDTILDIFLTANNEGQNEFCSYPGFAVIYGSAFEEHIIHLTH